MTGSELGDSCGPGRLSHCGLSHDNRRSVIHPTAFAMVLSVTPRRLAMVRSDSPSSWRSRAFRASEADQLCQVQRIPDGSRLVPEISRFKTFARAQ